MVIVEFRALSPSFRERFASVIETRFRATNSVFKPESQI